ncbi:dihydrofolate reductase [Nocardia neocaledoniensis NBRC 108232]|uniref:Phosphoglycerate dehydrogenase-like enzyme n=1 Tax=Nocardia neocaledoniensis TaxID=236511 RepID=A0A317NCB1_9NOCA|nr:D-isomer specific 2-hydroxyacid dehydrogenase family protein [Nocardia neocaledoniensis]PWV72881.1 phosphoglycerate dehydrogenase-like enzyme [Nocardia neocaledoniensis]GEM33670.1 dihydrofolate reductase [Nocardia neocaledoniensis NBRC 108232]
MQESATTIAIGPEQPSTRLLEKAIVGAGAKVGELADADALIWTGTPDAFPTELPAAVRWVQLPAAGIEDFFDAGVFAAHPDVLFTSAAGAFAHSVAEHALMLLLAGVRYLPEHLRATSWQQREFFPHVGSLRGKTVTILGAGGIGRALIPMLAPLGAHVIAVNRSGRPVTGAGIPAEVETVPAEQLSRVWSHTDHVVVAAPATAETRHLIGADELARLRPSSWVINVARGSLIDTDALVDALSRGVIGGAGLDVTDPEPLPDGHPLWTLPNAIITPHDSNPPQLRLAAFADHVGANVTRFVAGEPLLAIIEPERGY